MNTNPLRRAFALSAIVVALIFNPVATHASESASAVSTLSALPIAMSVAAPVMLLAAGASLVVVSVSATTAGTVWVLERASDGARAVITMSATGAGELSVAAGTIVVVTAISTGYVLSAVGNAIAFIPNEIGAALLYNEKVTR
ncbi:MAG: hypothetical protein ACI8WM_001432 [Burkholderiaceae bacterium]|jgi:hypothetical protein